MTSVVNSPALGLPVTQVRPLVWQRAALLAGGGGAVFLSRWLVRPGVADDYDSLNFLFGISRSYDLKLFQPQFPGYPVFIAAGAALHDLGLSALSAAELVSALASGLTGVALAVIAWRLAGKGAAIAALLFHLTAWLPWLIGSGALSDALGTALVALSFAALVGLPELESSEERSDIVGWPLLSGLAMGVALGVRASYWPFAIALSIAAFRQGKTVRARAATGFGLGALGWAVPFVSVVGPRQLIAIGKTHLMGHFEQWGGTVVTRPNLGLRLGVTLRGLFYDGLAPWLPALIALALLTVVVVVLRSSGDRWKAACTRVALICIPYALWAFFAQNIVEQPRHLLPLVEAEILLLACVLSGLRSAVLVAAALLAVCSVPLVREREQTPPAAVQMLSWLRLNDAGSDKVTWIVGTRSQRFFQELAPDLDFHQSPWLSFLTAQLARIDRMPDRILLTSEVDLHSGEGDSRPLPRRWHVEPVSPNFCRDARIDRGLPCLQLSQLTWVSR